MSKRRAQEASDLLAECLSAAEAGSAGLDICPVQYAPDEAAWRDLVSLALELRQMSAPPPSASFRSAGYRSLMTEIGQKPRWRWQPRRILQAPVALFASLFGGNRLRTASVWVSVLVAIILCLGTGGGVLAAEGALPGDLLYGLKITVEDVRLAVTPAEGDVSLHASFAGRRLGEVRALMATGRLADVPQAAAGYERHVGQAIRVLVAVGDKDAGVRDRLAAELEQMLSEQTTAWDALAGQVPAQMVPVIQQVQSASIDAQNEIRQLRTESGMGGEAEPSSSTPTKPLPGGTRLPPVGMPPASTSAAPPPGTPAELPLQDAPAEPPPASTPMPPPSTPVEPLPSTPAEPLPPATPAELLPQDTPAEPPPSTPAEPLPPATPAELLPQDTPAEPPPASTPVPPPGTPVEPPPASTPMPPPSTPAEPSPADTPAGPPPPPGGAPPGP
jgi:hypothetical protein